MKGIFLPVLLVLVFLALVANLLAFTVFDQRIPPEVISWIVGGVGAATGLVVNLWGLRVTTAALAKRSRTSLTWLRRGFLVGAILTALIVADSFMAESWVPEHKWKVGVLLLLIGTGPFFALLAARSEYRRAAQRESGSHGRH
jgi:hypothetical protein